MAMMTARDGNLHTVKLPSPSLEDLLCLQMADLLPIAAPCWPSLQEFALRDMNFSKFPEELAGVLVSVSYLDLADNKFECLPTELALLSNLKHLEITGNEPLQLEEEDVDTLAALPDLHTCNMRKSGKDLESKTG